jgi:hypothetical protein
MRLLYLALVGVLVAGGATGTAVAKGKIKGKQIAPNAIASKHLKTGAVTGDKIADGSVTTGKLAGGSVTGAKLAANTVTGAHVDEATLGRVPDAATLKGTSLEPIVLDLPNTQATQVVVASGPGWSVAVDCETTDTKLIVSRTSSQAMVLLDTTFNGAPPGLSVMKTNLFFTFTTPAFRIRVTAVTSGSATTQVDLSGLFAAGQFGSQKDCYYRGTVTTTP